MSTSKLSLDNEAELIQRVCAGDKEAFYALVEPCERGVFTAAMSILNNVADAEEVAQEAVLKAFSALPRFRGESRFSTWLIQITINEARLKLRKDRRHLYDSIDEPQTDETGDAFPKDFADWREIPSEELQRKELREALQRALQSLPQKYREVLILRDIQHLSIQETAQVLGIEEGTAAKRYIRALKRLKTVLADMPGGVEGI